MTLPHEHFPLSTVKGGADGNEPPAGYIARLEELERQVVREAQACGVKAFVEVTPVTNLRCVPMMQRISRDTGLHVVACTGFYLDYSWSPWVMQKTEQELADLMIRELTDEIAGTGARAGIIKIAGGDPQATPEYARIFRAAATASKQTGAAITTHSCSMALKHFRFLVEAGADPARLYMGHADFDSAEDLRSVADAGGHLIFTCWGIDRYFNLDLKVHADRVAGLIRAGFAQAVLMSIDYALIIRKDDFGFLSTEYEVPYRTPAALFRHALPMLRARGITDSTLQQIMVDNPRNMLVRTGVQSRQKADAAPIRVAVTEVEQREFKPESWPEAKSLANAYLAGWAYSKQLDDRLFDHWQTTDRFQPDNLQLAYRNGRPRAFLHGEIQGEKATAHLVAMQPGAVAEGLDLLRAFETKARQAGAKNLYGPHWATALFYGGYVLGNEPSIPQWDQDGTSLFVAAGFRIEIRGVLMVCQLNEAASQEPVPAGYAVVPVPCGPEFDARPFGYHATFNGEKAAHCYCRLYPNLSAPRGGIVGQVGNVTTQEPHRGKGLARMMVKRCLDDLRRMGAAEALIATSLDNEPALRAYERAGFQRRYSINFWSKALTP